MPIKSIKLIKNKDIPNIKPIKEHMNTYIEQVSLGLPRRNGDRVLIIGAPASGKTSLLLNLFKSKKMLRNKYHNIYLFTPISSFKSVKNHPFKDHDKIYHELTIEILEQINEELMNLKSELEDEDDVIY